MVTAGTLSYRLRLGTSRLPMLASWLVGDTQAKASHHESQGPSQEVSAWERLGASFLLPPLPPIFLRDNDSDGDDNDIDDDEGHYDGYHESPYEAPT